MSKIERTPELSALVHAMADAFGTDPDSMDVEMWEQAYSEARTHVQGFLNRAYDEGEGARIKEAEAEERKLIAKRLRKMAEELER